LWPEHALLPQGSGRVRPVVHPPDPRTAHETED
jgi:hypothetical protein